MKATVRKIIQETPYDKTWILTLEESMSYKTSQFVMLNVKRKFPDKKIPKAFSIACTPENRKEIWVTARIYPDGYITPAMDKLEVGDEIDVTGPHGKFVYESGKTTLLGAGTGIAPLRGILHCALNDNQEVELFYSDRSEKHLIYKKEFEKLDKENRIKSHFFVTREPANKKRYTHRINHEFLKKSIKSKDGFFYVCGPQAFVDDMIEVLKELGIKDNQIKKEMFE